MSSIIKSISLDPPTAELAANIPNFSKFVRECLIRYHLSEAGEWSLCKRVDDGRLCLPMHKPRCMKCWPAGPPTTDDWLTYVRKPRGMDTKYRQEPNPHYLDHEWVQSRAVDVNPPLFSFKDMDISGNAKSARNPSRSGILARLMGRLWQK